MVSLIIGIIVAGIVVAVVLNKKKSHSDAAPIVAQDPNVTTVETSSDLVPVIEEPVATVEQKATRKANAAKQAAAKKPAAKPVAKQAAAKKPVKKSK